MKDTVTLALEGSTYEGSVALLAGTGTIAEFSLQDSGNTPLAGRGERLMPGVEECLKSAGMRVTDITHVVCGAGPGRFTSLRIAGSAAKGLAAGLGVELYAASSLLLTVAGLRSPPESGEYLSILDAMRAEWFAGRVSVGADGVPAQHGPAQVLTADSLRATIRAEPQLRIIGPGQDIAAAPHARGVARILTAIFAEGPVDLGSWEPDYGRLPEAQVRREAAIQRPVAQ